MITKFERFKQAFQHGILENPKNFYSLLEIISLFYEDLAGAFKLVLAENIDENYTGIVNLRNESKYIVLFPKFFFALSEKGELVKFKREGKNIFIEERGVRGTKKFEYFVNEEFIIVYPAWWVKFLYDINFVRDAFGIFLSERCKYLGIKRGLALNTDSIAKKSTYYLSVFSIPRGTLLSVAMALYWYLQLQDQSIEFKIVEDIRFPNKVLIILDLPDENYHYNYKKFFEKNPIPKNLESIKYSQRVSWKFLPTFQTFLLTPNTKWFRGYFITEDIIFTNEKSLAGHLKISDLESWRNYKTGIITDNKVKEFLEMLEILFSEEEKVSERGDIQAIWSESQRRKFYIKTGSLTTEIILSDFSDIDLAFLDFSYFGYIYVDRETNPYTSQAPLITQTAFQTAGILLDFTFEEGINENYPYFSFIPSGYDIDEIENLKSQGKYFPKQNKVLGTKDFPFNYFLPAGVSILIYNFRESSI